MSRESKVYRLAVLQALPRNSSRGLHLSQELVTASCRMVNRCLRAGVYVIWEAGNQPMSHLMHILQQHSQYRSRSIPFHSLCSCSLCSCSIKTLLLILSSITNQKKIFPLLLSSLMISIIGRPRSFHKSTSQLGWY